MSDSEWVTYPVAAQLLGCGTTQVQRLIGRGRLTPRSAKRFRLSRTEVVALAVVLKLERTAKVANARSKVARRLVGPPDRKHDWLSVTQAAEVLRVSRQRVHALARTERVPAVRSGHRWWFRADQLEMVAAARAVNHPRWGDGSPFLP